MGKNNEKLIKRCETCRYYHSSQRELNFWDDIGFCTNDEFRFNTRVGRMVGVYDKDNLKDVGEVTGNPTHDIETISESGHTVMNSRYCLQVSEEFGCIYHREVI